jgi:hypothetical protein
MRFILIAILIALAAIVGTAKAQVTCDTTLPIVDSFDYRRSAGAFFTELAEGDRLGEKFFTADNNEVARLASVEILVEPIPGSDVFGEGRCELWSDNGDAFPNSLPNTLIDVLGNFTTPRSTNSSITLNVENLQIDLQPDTPYWFVLVSTTGTLRWPFSDYAFQNGCPQTNEEGRFGQVRSLSLNGTSWNSTLLDVGYISIFSVNRCNSTVSGVSPTPTASPAVPTPTASPAVPSPTPGVLPSVFPSPFPVPSGRPRWWVRS